MSKKHKRSAWADDAHGGCRKRTEGVVRKLARSSSILVGKFGEGVIQAAKVWFPESSKEA